MPEQRQEYPEWRKQHETLKYPFWDGATLSNSDLFFPEDALLDAALYPAEHAGNLRISLIRVSQEAVTLLVGDEQTPELAWASLDLTGETTEFELRDVYERPAGVLVSDKRRLTFLQAWPVGEHAFTYDALGFSADVVFPAPSNIFRGFLLEDGTVVTGDVWLEGGRGVTLHLTEVDPEFAGYADWETSETPLIGLQVHASGEPYFKREACESGRNDWTPPRPIRRVVFQHGCRRVAVAPDSGGDIKILPAVSATIDTDRPALRVTPLPGDGLSLSVFSTKTTGG